MSKIKAENAERFVQHCEMLSTLSTDYAGIIGFRIGFQIYNKLRRIELKATRMYEHYCNVGYTDEEREAFDRKITKQVIALIRNVPAFHLNGDPRGYALKIDSKAEADRAKIRELGIQTDMGGYGILAPEF